MLADRRCFLPHPPALSPKREGEARLLGFVDFCVRLLASQSKSKSHEFSLPSLTVGGHQRVWDNKNRRSACWRISGVFLPHPPAPSPKREGEARLLGFVVF